MPKTKRSAHARRPSDTRRRDTIPRTLLAGELRRQINRFDLNRNQAAAIVGDAASQLSRLMTGYDRDFSADRLVGMLTRLGTDVTITVRHAKRLGRRGRVRLVAS